MSFEAFIFDMDGTMIDDMSVHNQIWVDLLLASGAQVDPQTFHLHTSGMTSAEIIQRYLGHLLNPEEQLRFAVHKEEVYRQKYYPAPMPGLLEFMQSARQSGIRLALATAAPVENVRYIMDALDLWHYFDAIVTANDIRRGKPDPEIFLTAAGGLQVEPHKCLVFEDSPGGIEAARRACMKTVVLTTMLAPEEVCDLENVLAAWPDFTNLSPQRLS